MPIHGVWEEVAGVGDTCYPRQDRPAITSMSPASILTSLTFTVVGMFFLVVFFFVLLIVLRLVVARRERILEEKKADLRPLVYDLLTGEQNPDDVIATLKSVIPVSQREALEQVLLENAKVLKGHEQEILTFTFESFGFASEDIENLQRGDKIDKAKAAFHLGVMRTARATPYLLAELSARSPEVRFAALNALSKIGTPEAIAGVMDHLSADTEIETLRVAEVILERKQTFAPRLVGWLERGEEDRARLLLLINLLGVMKDTSAVPVLLGYLDHEYPPVRARAVRALGSIGDFGVCEPLMRLLDDVAPEVRAEAAEALGKLQYGEAAGRLGVGLNDPDLTVKMSCAVALSRLGDEGHTVLAGVLRAAEEQERGVVAEVLGMERLRQARGKGFAQGEL